MDMLCQRRPRGTCVIFATLQNCFEVVTLGHVFSVPMSRICYIGGVSMKSPVVKRSIVVAGHKTSVSLEDAFWNGLKEIAGRRHMTLSDLVGAIDSQRQHGNLSSALRLFVLDFYRTQLSDLHKQQGENDGTEIMSAARAFS
jgi:predicted DNA-binding ribbon-helix-helix protein